MKSESTLKIIPKIFGIYYIVNSLGALSSLNMLEPVGNETDKFVQDFNQITILMGKPIKLFMPLLFIIGIAFLFFGFIILRNQKVSMIINTILMVISLTWVSLFIANTLNAEATISSIFYPVFGDLSFVLQYVGYIFEISTMIVPGAIIYWYLFKMKKENG